ncbi:BCCT family transporter [Marinomonas sp. A79]|uniref:BCCT family transporter n=1 Tax=Marinomonas vulgaris TaxID=2823372 RepID=A0ABS5HDF4_9GAMM|nr:BCCT family transporter [Marinomonas vulgaris]MBR7889677.1 BCCT family transporter [Marinomonas vulgaris]
MKPSKTVSPSGLWLGTNKFMCIASSLMVFAFVMFAVTDVTFSNKVFNAFNGWITTNLSWYYIAVVSGVLGFSIWVALSRFGKIRLGRDDESPEFGFVAWFSMLFSCAIGTGLLFWSIGEPIMHMQGNPFMTMEGIQPNTVEAAQMAIKITMFHWGLHGWSVYILVGLCLAYFSYRRGLPLTVRSGLYPLLGERINGPIGHAVDLLAIFSTLFGTATTLGLGVSQMNAGLNYLFGMSISTQSQLILIAVVTLVATLSALSGVGRGIKTLSIWNIRLSVLVIVFFVVAGPTVFLLDLAVSSVGDYAVSFVAMGFWVDLNPEGQWQGWWTIFYWGWWLSWGPLVGMFIARISRGRTIRQFMLSALIIPPLGGFIWIVVFGGTALHIDLFQGGHLTQVVNDDITQALYSTIEALGVESLTGPVALLSTILIVTWFVTSADSGTLVISTIISQGSAHPPKWLRLAWGVGLGVVSAVLLLAGGLDALKTASIIAAFPFSIILVFMCWALAKGLNDEKMGVTYTENDLAKQN